MPKSTSVWLDSVPRFDAPALDRDLSTDVCLVGAGMDSLEDIAPAQGAVVAARGHKIAVYRDEAGALHRRSAVSPHLGCIVAWNPAASTWDCPGHGSRFDKFGAVMNGPAPRDLDKA